MPARRPGSLWFVVYCQLLFRKQKESGSIEKRRVCVAVLDRTSCKEPMMSRKFGWKILAFVFALGLVAFAPDVVAAQERPFKATLTGNAHLSPTDDPSVLRNDETGAGVATELGRFNWADVEYVDFDAIPNGVAV